MTMTAPVSTATHPLSRLTAEEFSAVREIVHEARLVTEMTKFVYVGLEEPHKRVVLAWQSGDPIKRTARVLLLDRATGNGRDLTVSITGGAVVEDKVIDALVDGQVPILDAEFEAIEPILAADERWVAAMTKRGLDIANVRSVPLSAGS